MNGPPPRDPGRRTPAKGVHLSSAGSNWVLLTVCTEKRERWLAQPAIRDALHEIWSTVATGWLVSDYLLMPDHLHLFCAPHKEGLPIEKWVSFWKHRFTVRLLVEGRFQAGCFHHRLRNGDSYEQKWHYVQTNPVRAGLVERAEEWSYSGRVHDIVYRGK